MMLTRSAPPSPFTALPQAEPPHAAYHTAIGGAPPRPAPSGEAVGDMAGHAIAAAPGMTVSGAPPDPALAPGWLTFSGPIDGDALIGAFAGAVLVTALSRSQSLTQRLTYLFVSLIAGYLSAPEIVSHTAIDQTGLAAFLAASMAITVTLRLRQRVAAAGSPSGPLTNALTRVLSTRKRS